MEYTGVIDAVDSSVLWRLNEKRGCELAVEISGVSVEYISTCMVWGNAASVIVSAEDNSNC